MVGDGFRVHNFFPSGYKLNMSPFFMLGVLVVIPLVIGLLLYSTHKQSMARTLESCKWPDEKELFTYKDNIVVLETKDDDTSTKETLNFEETGIKISKLKTFFSGTWGQTTLKDVAQESFNTNITMR